MIRDWLKYDPETGVIIWRMTGRKMRAGSVAGTVDSKGYIRIGVERKYYRAHHIAWLLHYGEWPGKRLDHINGVRNDNRIVNLRLADHAENMQNRKPSKNSRTGLLGVQTSWDGRFKAEIAVNKVRHQLGTFDTPEEAYEAYLSAKKRLHTFCPQPPATLQHGVQR